MRLLLLLVVFGITVQSCLFVKAPEQKVDVQNVALSPLPEIEMSDELVRTRSGDFIALLPKGWLFLDTKGDASADILAIAVSPDYTLTLVVSAAGTSEPNRESSGSDGLLELARTVYQRHVRKSAGTVKLVGTYRIAEMGPRRFGLYEFAASSALRTRSAVCTSSIGNNYEISLVPVTVSGKDIPDAAEQDRIFRSILTTVQY